MATRSVIALQCLLALLLHRSDANWHTPCMKQDCSQTVGSRSFPCTVQKQSSEGGKCSDNLPHVHRHHDGDHVLPKLPREDVEIDITSDQFKSYGEFPGINVSVKVPLTTGSQRVTGIQIILRGKNGDHDYRYTYHNQEICRILDFDGADMTSRMGETETVTFFYDCLRPLSPQSTYEVEVNLLPYSEFGHKGVIKTVVTPPCSSQNALKIHECFIQRDEYQAIHWGPTIFDVNLIDRNVSVDFNLPNDTYQLDRFRVLLYTKNGGYVSHQDIIPGKDDIYIIAASNGKMYSVVRFTPFANVEDGEYVVKLQPIPTKGGVCKSVYDNTDDCKVTVSKDFTVNELTKKKDRGKGKKKNRDRSGRKNRRKDRKNKKDKKSRRGRRE